MRTGSRFGGASVAGVGDARWKPRWRRLLLAPLLLLARCGPMPPGAEPIPLIDHGGGPALPDYRGNGGMGDPDENAGMGIGGGVQAGGGPALP